MIEENILKLTQKVTTPEIEAKSIYESLGFVLAQDLKATIDSPPFDNSRMDGYAVSEADIAGANNLKIADAVSAGHKSEKTLHKGECVRIMTGAPVPEGTAAVLKLEDAVETKGSVSFNKILKNGENINYSGKIYRKGDILMRAGTRLKPMQIACAAGAGYDVLPVYRRPSIGILNIGDELQSPGTQLKEGNIYDSNEHGIYMSLMWRGLKVKRAGLVKDDFDKIKNVIENLRKSCDIIISIGGAGTGDKDFVKTMCERLDGEIMLRAQDTPLKVPGLIYNIGVPVVGLSGNPFAALNVYAVFADALIRKTEGETEIFPRRYVIENFPQGRRRTHTVKITGRGFLFCSEKEPFKTYEADAIAVDDPVKDEIGKKTYPIFNI